MKKTLFFALSLLFALSACDEIPEGEYLKNVEVGGYEGTGHKVFLEEFTGVKCNNCPAANAKAKELQSIYGKENLILLGIHAGNLATTDAKHPKAFNTPEGTELFNFFQLFGVPVGFVNRIDHSTGGIIKGEGDWAGLVAQELERLPVAEITIQEDSYNSSTRELSVSGTVQVTGTINSSNVHLCLYLAENGIISPQTMGDKSVNENYKHDHVFRGSFNGTYGAPIDLSSGNATFSESITLVNNTANGDIAVKENCEVIAFIYDKDTYEILQAQSIEI